MEAAEKGINGGSSHELFPIENCSKSIHIKNFLLMYKYTWTPASKKKIKK